jgi:aspartyl-tRNA(Asn)/glutamyl-tRNA(Gln) amidotransferase subunit B
LSDYDAGFLTAERSTAEFFEEAVDAGGEPKRVCNWITQDGLRLANERGCSVAELGITPKQVAELATMIVMGDVSATAATAISDIMVTSEDLTPQQIAEEQNLIQKSDVGELEHIVEQVFAENPKAVEDVKSDGKKSKKARGFLLGQVMQKTKGQANPKVVSEILAKKLS